jgi:hypothetical protein
MRVKPIKRSLLIINFYAQGFSANGFTFMNQSNTAVPIPRTIPERFMEYSRSLSHITSTFTDTWVSCLADPEWLGDRLGYKIYRPFRFAWSVFNEN